MLTQNENPIDQLKFFLKEMFQFNANDLDFGIYRIYNLKRKEIENFIDGKDEQCLEPIINDALKEVKNNSRKAELTELENYLKSLNQQDLLSDVEGNYGQLELFIKANKDEAKKEELLNSLSNATKEFNITDEIKDKIYNHILGYFEMYYSNGDFGYNNRSRSLYKVPYETDYDGNDTMFHWKHKGSLYIKTGASFNAIKFKIKHLNKEFELRLETNEESTEEGTARNNNKDTKSKHYKFNRFEEVDGVTRIVFNLSDNSTTKADLFKDIFKNVFKSKVEIEKYLFAKNDKGELKPIFNDLSDDYDKVQDGGVKGIGALRVNRKTILGKINKNFEKGTKVEIIDDLFSDETLETIYNIDQKLNSFYIGNDSDYFIHENLQEFLTQEKERYIKNHILSDLKSILDGKLDNTTLIIAKAFELVSSRIIEFLSAIEEFQKKLFIMKKKVVESEYCLTIDNIDEKYYKEILENKAQLTEWENLFSVKVKTLTDIKAQPTLVLDTKFFKQKDGSNPFKDKILAEIDNLDEKTNGLLINSENYQAITFLSERYNGSIDNIYIDPPYNSPSSAIIYKNNFKHSSWATLMYNRLKEAKPLLNEKGCQIIAIDENEQNNLFILNADIYKSEHYDNALIAVEHNKKGIQGDHFSYSSEFAIFSIPYILKKINAIELPETDWEWSNFRNWGGESLRTDAKNCFYPVKVNSSNEIVEFGAVCDDLFHPKSSNVKEGKYTLIYPIDSEGVERKWRYAQDTVKGIRNRLKVEADSDGSLQIKLAKVSRPFKTMWYDTKYNAGDYGTKLLTSLGFKKGDFDFPKSIHLVYDCLFVNDKVDSLNFDFFAGSGTTGHAVILMNKQLNDGNGKRKYILTEMGKYFHLVTKVRIQKAIFSDKWQNGKPNSIKGSNFHIFKYLTIEQYEDVLDAIEQFDGVTPKNLPLKYIYKPEINKINSTLDLSKPFSNKIKFGQPTKEGFVDLVDTYNYLQGYEVKNIKPYTIGKKYFKVVETTDTLVIWRDISLGEDDSKAIKEIAEKYPEATQIEINYDFNILATLKDKQLEVGKRLLGLTVIHADIFNQ